MARSDRLAARPIVADRLCYRHGGDLQAPRPGRPLLPAIRRPQITMRAPEDFYNSPADRCRVYASRVGAALHYNFAYTPKTYRVTNLFSARVPASRMSATPTAVTPYPRPHVPG